jgi:hypothetical protein
MRETRIHFSLLLPLIDLALLVLLVFVPITLTALHLYEASKGSNQVNIHSDAFDMSIPRNLIVPAAIRIATVPKAHAMVAINIPGILFEILISLPTSWPASWHPAALLLDTWRALVFPFFCLPFWWLVGRGLDGLLGKQRLHWSLLLIGTLFFGLCFALALGFHVSIPMSERDDSGWIIRGLTGWTVAFAILPIAWIAQVLRRRHAMPAAS